MAVEEEFNGIVEDFEAVDGKIYKLKTPPSKVLPNLGVLMKKNPQEYTEEDLEKLRKILSSLLEKSFPKWPEENRDEFLVLNYGNLQLFLPVVLGWISKDKYKEIKNEQSRHTAVDTEDNK
jgi:hypothetical protein